MMRQDDNGEKIPTLRMQRLLEWGREASGAIGTGQKMKKKRKQRKQKEVMSALPWLWLAGLDPGGIVVGVGWRPIVLCYCC